MTQENKAITIGLVRQNITIIFIIVPMIFWVANVNGRLNENEKTITGIETHFKEEQATYDSFEIRLNSNDIRYAEIKVSLKSIDAKLIELTNRIKY